MSEEGESLSVEELTQELLKVGTVANDRLVFMRVLETAVNDMQNVLTRVRNDVTEINTQIMLRNSGHLPVPENNSTVEEEE
jgi:hypothetical protein